MTMKGAADNCLAASLSSDSLQQVSNKRLVHFNPISVKIGQTQWDLLNLLWAIISLSSVNTWLMGENLWSCVFRPLR